jgi:pyruvate/2-oxoglutarate dehydrogenase complex dihydrolipoamide acyltransferase (E2) component
MMGLFSRRRKFSADTGGLGATLIALRLDEGDVAPSHSTVVVFNAGGHARRVAAGKVSCEQGETVFCFHPGPYTVDVTPFASAPEWGLRLRFVVDAANPRVTQQRFDLYLYSETAGRLELADFSAAVEMTLQAELAQGALELPPCTTLEEWHAFRAGLNQLMYTRYGVTVDDCVPVDLGDQIDYATILQTRAQQAAEAERVRFIATEAAKAVQSDLAPAAAPAVSTPAAAAAGKAQTNAPGAQSRATSATASPATPGLGRESDVALPSDAAVSRQPAGRTPSGAASVRATAKTAEQDARALRRLFLELPALGSGLRLLTLPNGLPIFQQHQAVLLRLGMAALNVNTMPSLAWAAPDQPLSMAGQARRVAQTMIAQSALDEAWSLLARLQLADPQQWPALLDEADRICTNLETGLSLRRIAQLERMEPSL